MCCCLVIRLLNNLVLMCCWFVWVWCYLFCINCCLKSYRCWWVWWCFLWLLLKTVLFFVRIYFLFIVVYLDWWCCRFLVIGNWVNLLVLICYWMWILKFFWMSSVMYIWIRVWKIYWWFIYWSGWLNVYSNLGKFWMFC